MRFEIGEVARDDGGHASFGVWWRGRYLRWGDPWLSRYLRNGFPDSQARQMKLRMVLSVIWSSELYDCLLIGEV